jgi:hypothetical protein
MCSVKEWVRELSPQNDPRGPLSGTKKEQDSHMSNLLIPARLCARDSEFFRFIFSSSRSGISDARVPWYSQPISLAPVAWRRVFIGQSVRDFERSFPDPGGIIEWLGDRLAGKGVPTWER